MSTKTAMPNGRHLAPATEAGLAAGRCLPKSHWAVVVLALCCFAGCSDGDPFPLEQITGKVTYSDGSLIDAKMIKIICKSIDVEAVGKKSPRGARGVVDPETGQIEKISTWKTGDGVICGRNKVAIVPLEFGKGIDPMGRHARRALAEKYFSTDTSPLEIEVVSGGENHFELTVEKPGK